MGTDSTDHHPLGEELRFGAGWRRLTPREPEPTPAPDVVVDIIRPGDLLSLTVAGFEVELVEGDSPLLRATGSDARLVVEFVQAHHIDTGFYDAYYREGAYLETHARYSELWHDAE